MSRPLVIAGVFAVLASAIASFGPHAAAAVAVSASPGPTSTPKPHASPKASPHPAASKTPLAAVLTPPTPSLPDTDVMGKIGQLERAGAGPHYDSDKSRRQRTTSPSTFSQYLADPTSATAARAAIAIGRLRNPSGVSALVSLLQNHTASDEVKADAAFALGVIGSSSADAVLVNALFHESPAVAGAAADALGRIGGDAVIDPLDRALASHDPFVRGKAAIGLGEATAVPPSPQPLRLDAAYRQNAGSALASAIQYERDPEAKWREAWAIGRSLYDIDQSNLKTMITDKSELVRIFAVQGMRRLNDPKNVLTLHLAANDSSWRVRVEVKRALVSLRDTATTVDTSPPDIPDTDQEEPTPLDPSTPYGPNPEVAVVTSQGTFVLELFPDEAPYNVDNFLYLVDKGYYDRQELFRVIQDFVIQGGDPTETGDGGPGYSVPAELNPVEQLTGVIALGLDYPNNAADVDSGGSQFYVTESPQLHLDMAFSTFGRVVKGMPVVYNIRTHAADTAAERKLEADVVEKMYRCAPVIDQSADIERMLRTKETGYDPE